MSLLLQTLMKILKKFRRRKLNEITIHFEQAVYQTMFDDSSLALHISCVLSTSQYTYLNERSVSNYTSSQYSCILSKDKLRIIGYHFFARFKGFIYELKLYCP